MDRISMGDWRDRPAKHAFHTSLSDFLLPSQCDSVNCSYLEPSKKKAYPLTWEVFSDSKALLVEVMSGQLL